MPSKTITLIGGDLRQEYLAEDLLKKGFSVCLYGCSQTYLQENDCLSCKTLSESMQFSHVIIGPIPFSRNQITIHQRQLQTEITIEEFNQNLTPYHVVFGGCFPQALKAGIGDAKAFGVDLMEEESVCIKNAVATAEGMIAEAIKNSTINLCHSTCLVLGYGRCGKTLADRLLGMHARISVLEKKRDLCALAESFGFYNLIAANLEEEIGKYDFIFNTIPELILNRDLIEQTKSEVCILDIASKPGGTDFAACRELKRNARLCPSLPGVYAPKSSAHILSEAILQRMTSFSLTKQCRCAKV